MSCIVCRSDDTQSFKTKDQKTYWDCNNCFAKYLDKDFYLDKDSEKSRYLEHQNEIGDPAYIKFLSKLIDPLRVKLNLNDRGLDFGCGHGPALAEMLRLEGFSMDLYDPFFFPNKDIFSNKYNFITCTETAEHFFNPNTEFETLNSLLLPGAWLGVMTTFLTDNNLFNDWYYRRDPAHVVFYSRRTFEVIAEQMNWDMEVPQKDVVLFHKK